MEKFQDILGRKMEINEISKAKAGQAYTTMRSFDTMEKLAQNEGGGAAAANMTGMGFGAGVGLGAGMPIGNTMGSAMNVSPNTKNKRQSYDKTYTTKKTVGCGINNSK